MRVSVFARNAVNGRKSLWINYIAGGKRYRKSLNLFLIPEKTSAQKIQNSNTLALAEAIARKKTAELDAIDNGIEIFNATNILFKDYAIQTIDKAHSESSRHARLELITSFEKFRKELRLVDITRNVYADFVEFMQKENYANNTIIMRCNILKAILHAAKLDNAITIVPDFTGLTPPKVPTNRSFLTIDELRSMVQVPFEMRLKAPFLFSCFTGLRLSDVRSLKWSDIENNVITLRMQKTKEIVHIPLSANALKFMPKRMDDGLVFSDFPTCEEWYGRKLKEWARLAGITKRISFHVARHTFATLALANGADLFTVGKLLGHTKITTTQIYAKVLDEGRKKAVDAIPEL